MGPLSLSYHYNFGCNQVSSLNFGFIAVKVPLYFVCLILSLLCFLGSLIPDGVDQLVTDSRLLLVRDC